MKSSILYQLLITLTISIGAFAAPCLGDQEHQITYKIASDVKYYKDLTLDIYYNERNFKKLEKLPVFMFFHGGFWLMGDKSLYSKGGELFQHEGYVAVIPKYTVFANDPTITIDDMVDEVYHAIKWTHENIYRYGGDPLRITVSGHSAGAHLAALTLVKSDYKIKNKGKYLDLPKLKHLLLLNGPYTMDVNAAVQLLNAMNLSQIALGINLLFGNATNAFPLDILTERNNKILSLSAKQVTVFDTEGDLLITSDIPTAFKNELERTTLLSNVEYVQLPNSETAVIPDEYGGHSRIVVDLYSDIPIFISDVEAKALLLKLVKKYNKPTLLENI